VLYVVVELVINKKKVELKQQEEMEAIKDHHPGSFFAPTQLPMMNGQGIQYVVIPPSPWLQQQQQHQQQHQQMEGGLSPFAQQQHQQQQQQYFVAPSFAYQPGLPRHEGY